MNCNAAFFSLKSAVARTRAYACRGGFVLLVEIILSLQFHHQIQVQADDCGEICPRCISNNESH